MTQDNKQYKDSEEDFVLHIYPVYLHLATLLNIQQLFESDYSARNAKNVKPIF